jgi:RNA polymerase sigma-70 factor, ECF subfamily
MTAIGLRSWVCEGQGQRSDTLVFVLSLASVATLDSATRATDSSRMDEADRCDILASLGGDGEAYRRIVQRHQQFVAGRMRRFARHRGTLEELVHDVFVEAYFALKSFRGEAPLEHWLARIATRVGYRYWKRRDRAMKTKALTEQAAARKDKAPLEGELEAVLAELSPRDRLVVTLLYLDERSVAEAAELTGWSRTMVKVQAYRARGKLRKLMVGKESA